MIRYEYYVSIGMTDMLVGNNGPMSAPLVTRSHDTVLVTRFLDFSSDDHEQLTRSLVSVTWFIIRINTRLDIT